MQLVLALLLPALAGQAVADQGGAHDVGGEMPLDSRYQAGERYGFWLYIHLGQTFTRSAAVTWEVELLLRSAARTSQAAFDTQVAGTPMSVWYNARTAAERESIRLAIARQP